MRKQTLLFVSAVAFVVSSISLPLAAADKQVVTIKMAHTAAEDTSLQMGGLKLKELLEASGLFKMQIFPSAQLGGDRELLEALQNNDIQLNAANTAPGVTFVPAAVIFDMPFVYTDKALARKALNDPEFFSIMSEEYGKSGYKLLGFTDMGFRTLTANIKAMVPDDLKGLVMRVIENPYHMEIWKQIGTNPTPIPFNEVYTALQQGTCDAQDQSIEMMYSSRVYEQQKYAIETNHLVHILVWLTNKGFYDSLSSEHKTVFDQAVKEMVKTGLEFSDKSYDRYKDIMQKAGIQFIALPEENQKLFAARAKSTWNMIEKAAGPKVYEAFQNALKRAIAQ
jgi:tripartite ATP-independent transporter DctP family solute receptor